MNKSEPVYNVFEALGFVNVEEMTARANLASKIIGVVRVRGLSCEAAAELVGCAAVRIEQVCNADLDDFTIDELCRYLVALGQDVQIAVKPTADTEAHLCVTG